MRDRAYWKKRFEQLEQAQHQIGNQCFADIEKQYRKAQKQIEGQISMWYQRFISNNGSISLQEAKRMLSDRELDELKWDVREYIRHGEENAVSGEWMQQLENASARYHISRLEALKLHTQQSLETLFGKQLSSIDHAMRESYISGYYHTAFEIQKGVGVGWDFATLDEKAIAKVICKPWAADGKNFSERVWGNRKKLVRELETTLTQNIILGQDPQKAIDAIAKELERSKNVTGRLVMTEEAFFSSAAQRDCFQDLDVEQYEILATLDSHTSEICRNMDGKVFKASEWEIGQTAPPFHVWCRSTTIPAFGDEFDAIGKRAARGEDGKTYYVPAGMTYQEWQQAFVEGDKSGLQEATPDDTIKSGANDWNQYVSSNIIKTDNQSIREWYVANVSDIQNQIDRRKSFEEQVRQAYELRNEYKRMARAAMSDEETAAILEKKRPVKTFDELLRDKMKRKNMSKEEALMDILKTASKTNENVNKEFGL